jgi:hypothetical protein
MTKYEDNRKLADAARHTQIVGTRDAYRADDRQDGFGAEFLVLGVMATRTRQLALLGRRGLELQQFGQGGGPRLVQSGSQGRLHGFQIGPTVLMALCKNKAEESIYFSRHFLMDRSSVFFSCSVQPPRCCSTGRSRQIFSLRATRSWLSFWKR